MEINIAVTGRNGSGKSSLISCIYEAMRGKMPGYFSLPEAEDFDALDRVYKELEAKAASTKSEFAVNFTKSNNELWEYEFLLKDKNSSAQIFFQENPEELEGTKVFVAAVDTPLLMNGYEAECGISEAQEMFIETLESSDEDALLIVVPVKSEAYTRQDSHNLISKTASALNKLVEISRTTYRDRASIAILPINTLGGASFADFLRKDGRITGEIFRRDKNTNFQPEGAEIIMKLAISFMINNGEISGEAVNKIASLSGAKPEILCGHELLDPKPKKPEKTAKPQNNKGIFSSALKISAVIIIILAVAGSGLYAIRSMSENTQIIIEETNQQAEEARTRAEQEISEAKASERSAILERNKARNEVRTLQDEKDRAMEMANRYKKQFEDLQAENNRLQAEISRLTKKLNDSIIITNPFK